MLALPLASFSQNWADDSSLDEILNTKDALAHVQKKVKELGPDIKKLAKEVNAKIKKNPAGKVDYLKVYQSDPDVKEFIKLRKMLKAADLL